MVQLACTALVACTLGGCAPVLDWRGVRVPDSALVAQLPCRPGRFQREIVIAGAPLAFFMLSCEAGGMTYGVASADVGDATRVAPVLAALAQAARGAIRASAAQVSAFDIPGATPFRGSIALRLRGVRPDGQAVVESVRLFARGTRVFEASALGAGLPGSAVEPFEDGLRFDLENADTGPR